MGSQRVGHDQATELNTHNKGNRGDWFNALLRNGFMSLVNIDQGPTQFLLEW